ncbi:MAG: MarR family transcriptional regulator [Polyangiaceae bacterium]|nr:MarR family transcriptional regulator [Polyangiaceae bacterium]
MASVPPELKQEVDSIVEAIVYLYTESRRLTKGLAARYGLTGPQLTVVKMLESIGDMSLSELSDRIHAKNSTVTGIIDRMEGDGLVVRDRSQRDRRVVHIRLTPKGRALAADVPLLPAEILRKALESLTRDEARLLLRVLTKLAHRVRTLVADSDEQEGKT